MTKHDFIFFNQRSHRNARHAAFWIVWWLSFTVFFHWPVHTFKGWVISESENPTFQKLGLPLLILKTLFINSLVAVILPQIIFTYVLIYWLLPNYFYKKRNPLVTAGVIIGVLIIYFFVAVVFKYLSPWFDYIIGLNNTLPPFNGPMLPVIRDQVTTLPIVAGFAVMIKLMKRWWFKQNEIEQFAREKAKAELQLLKAQIHPHFLFNTLNNIYFFTLTNSAQAPEMIKKLSGMLHYILNECNQPLVRLDKEIKMIQDYMALEKIRYGVQMQMTIEIQENYDGKMIAPLLLIPFVENSFKHGASKMLTHPYVKLSLSIENNMLHFFIQNSQPQTFELVPGKVSLPNRHGNIGLKNVKKRLQLLYPSAHELNIVSEPESFTVYLKIQLQEMTTSPASNEEIKSTAAYAMA